MIGELYEIISFIKCHLDLKITDQLQEPSVKTKLTTSSKMVNKNVPKTKNIRQILLETDWIPELLNKDLKEDL